MLIVAGVVGTKWHHLGEVLSRNSSVREWLLSDIDVTSLMSRADLEQSHPFDFFTPEKGPCGQNVESADFRRSLMVPMVRQSDITFGEIIRFDSAGVTRRRLVCFFDPSTQDFCALIRVELEDGGFMLRGTVSKRSDAYTASDIFVAVASRHAQSFTVRQTMHIDKDCLYCQQRQVPCECKPAMKWRDRQFWAANLAPAKTSWSLAQLVSESMTGPCWATMNGQQKVRSYTEATRRNLQGTLQELIAVAQAKSLLPPVRREGDAKLSPAPGSPIAAESLLSAHADREASEGAELAGAVVVEESVQPADAQLGPRGGRGRRTKEATCELCGQSFPSSYHVRRHQNGVHFKMKNFECDECGKRYTQRGHLLAHVNTAHSKAAAKLQCQHCSAVFTWRTNLLRHHRTAHKS